MEYKEISIVVKSTSDGDSFESWVTSQAGSSQPSRVDDSLMRRAQRLQRTLRREVRARREAEATKTARGIGKTLSRAVFPGEARKLLQTSLDEIEGWHDRGLRIKLRTFTADLADLSPMLWELLPHPGRDAFLSQSEQTPIVRHLHLAQPTEPLPFKPPLRILVALANPTNTPPLDLETERRAIKESVASQQGVEVKFLDHATLEAMLKELEKTPYHVLHFMGHGGFDDEGNLVFEDEDGRADRVTGRQLARDLEDVRQNHPSLSLVFLNACKSGTAASNTGANAETPEPGTREGATDVQADAQPQAEAPPPTIQPQAEASPPITEPQEKPQQIQPAAWDPTPLWTKKNAEIPEAPPAPSDTPDAAKTARPGQQLSWGASAPWAQGGAAPQEPTPEATGEVLRIPWAHAAPWGRFLAHLTLWSYNVPWARSVSWARNAPWAHLDLEQKDGSREDGADEEAVFDEAFDPFGGVALALMHEGIPAVVAMQFSISDTAAKAFAREFYQRLMLGTPVDVAVNVGRIAIETAQKKDDAAGIKPLEWMTPVLYMRASDGMLFKRNKPDILTENDDLQILLRKVKRAWIEEILTPSVLDGEPINLGMEKAPETVNPPPRLHAASRNRPIRIDKRISDAFDTSGGSLLILGGPGSGKTTTLLALTRALLPRAEASLTEPVPVVFDLATWTGTSLLAWLIDELGAKYQIPAPTARAWLLAEKPRLLPLLDGLDAVEAEDRVTCVEAINAFVREIGHQGIAVTCRQEEYTALMEASHRLDFAEAIRLKPLTASQIDAYVARAGKPLAGLRNALRIDAALRRQAQSPETLDVLTKMYVEEDLPADTPPGDLLDTYIDRMFARQQDPNPPYSRAQTMAQLQWLAQRMTTHRQNIFLIERMQPNWLSSRWQRVVNLLMFSIILGVIVGGLAALAWMMSEGLDPSVDPLNCVGKDGNPLHVARLVPFPIWWLSCSVWLFVAGVLGWRRLPWMQQSISAPIRLHWRTQMIRIVAFFGIWALIWTIIEGVIWLLDLEDLEVHVSHPAIVGAILAILYAVRVDTIHYIRTVEALGWSRKHAWLGLLGGAVAGLAVWAIYVAANWQGFPWGAEWGTMSHLVLNLMLYPPVAAAGGFLIGGIRIRIDARKTAPNQGVRLSVTNAFKGMLTAPVVGLVSFLVFPIALVCTDYGVITLIGAGFATVITAIVAFLWYGGLDLLKHLTLRIMLRGTEKWPAMLVPFFDYAAGLNLLRKVGGGYLFVNRALQAHFAAMEEAPSE